MSDAAATTRTRPVTAMLVAFGFGIASRIAWDTTHLHRRIRFESFASDLVRATPPTSNAPPAPAATTPQETAPSDTAPESNCGDESSTDRAWCFVDARPLRDAVAAGDLPSVRTAMDGAIVHGGVNAGDIARLFVTAERDRGEALQQLQELGNAYRIDVNAVLSDLRREEAFEALVRAPSNAAHDDTTFAVGELRHAPFRAALLRAVIKSDCSGYDHGAVSRVLLGARPDEQEELAYLLTEAINDGSMVSWLDAVEGRRRRIVDIVMHVKPQLPSMFGNDRVDPRVDEYSAHRERFPAMPYDVIIVPGYTPADLPRGTPGVHPVTHRRLEAAVRDWRLHRAPFILVTGANIYPAGTPYYEAIEMRQVLIDEFGVPPEVIIVDPYARHSTTNLRNAGRYMLAHGLRRALITTLGGGVLGSDVFDQDFYFSNPDRSHFYDRSEHELGYRVGELSESAIEPRFHSDFVPSVAVNAVNYRDPLDP